MALALFAFDPRWSNAWIYDALFHSAHRHSLSSWCGRVYYPTDPTDSTDVLGLHYLDRLLFQWVGWLGLWIAHTRSSVSSVHWIGCTNALCWIRICVWRLWQIACYLVQSQVSVAHDDLKAMDSRPLMQCSQITSQILHQWSLFLCHNNTSCHKYSTLNSDSFNTSYKIQV